MQIFCSTPLNLQLQHFIPKFSSPSASGSCSPVSTPSVMFPGRLKPRQTRPSVQARQVTKPVEHPTKGATMYHICNRDSLGNESGAEITWYAGGMFGGILTFSLDKPHLSCPPNFYPIVSVLAASEKYV